MALNTNLLEILVCPENKSRVSPVNQELIDRLNERIMSGNLFNRSQNRITEAIDGGLIREDGKVLYPVRGDIPVMLIEEGILIEE